MTKHPRSEILFLIIQILKPCLARRSVAWIFFLTVCASVLLIVKNGISQVNSESTDSMYKVVRVSIAPVIDGYLDEIQEERVKETKKRREESHQNAVRKNIRCYR